MYDNLFWITSGNFECHFKWKPIFGSEKRDAVETRFIIQLAIIMNKNSFLLPDNHQRRRELRVCPLFNNKEPYKTGPQELHSMRTL
jgi:hypothetical protein